ncbi:MAG: hypothetical protein ING73_00715 [Rhodocyclaceae bacterium]|nr:hypothetical protein [Rhodocyclaceae bacterium]
MTRCITDDEIWQLWLGRRSHNDQLKAQLVDLVRAAFDYDEGLKHATSVDCVSPVVQVTPTRISCEPEDEGYSRNYWFYDVKFNGEAIEYVVTADSLKGFVKVLQMPIHVIGDEPATEVKFGLVEIVPRPLHSMNAAQTSSTASTTEVSGG